MEAEAKENIREQVMMKRDLLALKDPFGQALMPQRGEHLPRSLTNQAAYPATQANSLSALRLGSQMSPLHLWYVKCSTVATALPISLCCCFFQLNLMHSNSYLTCEEEEVVIKPIGSEMNFRGRNDSGMSSSSVNMSSSFRSLELSKTKGRLVFMTLTL